MQISKHYLTFYLGLKIFYRKNPPFKLFEQYFIFKSFTIPFSFKHSKEVTKIFLADCLADFVDLQNEREADIR